MKRITNESNRAVTEALERNQIALPDGVRYHRKVGDIEYLIFEEKPKIRTLLVDMSNSPYVVGQYDHRGVVEPVRLSLPYMVYKIAFREHSLIEFKCFFSKKPIRSLNQDVYVPHLPNVYPDGKACVPWEHLPSSKDGLSNVIDAVVNKFWGTEFNYGLHEHWKQDARVNSFQEWQRQTDLNPLFILDVNWNTTKFKIADILNCQEAKTAVNTSFQAESSRLIEQAIKILSLQAPLLSAAKVEKKEPVKASGADYYGVLSYRTI